MTIHMKAIPYAETAEGKRSMSNKGKIGWYGGIVLLVVLYLLSSTDLIIKEKKKEIRRVAVIIEQVNDNYYGNFREGMDMAEKISGRCEFYHVVRGKR